MPISWTNRQYESEADLRHMQALLVEGRAQTNDWHYPHIGDLNFWFFMVLCHLDPGKFIRLWHNEEGKLVGYAILGEDPSFDCQVLPGYEWLGIEEEAFTWAVGCVLELRQADAKRWGGPLVSGVRQDDRKRMAFLQERGFFHRGTFDEVNMLCSLEGNIPKPNIPTGYRVRSFAGASEVANRASAQRQVWQPWSVGEVSDENYISFMRLPGYDRELDVVALAPDGIIAAYVNGWIEPLNRVGDFGPVGARETYRRQGLTRAVLLECLHRMQNLGMDRVLVSTNNEPARKLYESVGFRIVNQTLDFVKNP